MVMDMNVPIMLGERINIAIITGTTSATLNTSVSFTFPSGFNKDNCFPIYYEVTSTTNNIRTYGLLSNDAPLGATISWNDPPRIITRNSEFAGCPFRVVLMKIS